MEIIVNETIDTTPKDLVNPSKVVLYNSSNGANVRLANAVIKQQDEVSVFITLTEKQRVEAIALSSTNGGDTTALTLSVEAGAMQDIGTNKNNRFDGIFVTEVADTAPPALKSASINLTQGELILVFSETVNRDLLFNVSGVSISNRTTAFSPIKVSLEGAVESSVVEKGPLRIVLQLNEVQRSYAHVTSSQPGGDGHDGYIHIERDKIMDMATNKNLKSNDVVLVSFPDIVNPRVSNVSVELTNGTLFVVFSESIINDAAYIFLKQMFMIQISQVSIH